MLGKGEDSLLDIVVPLQEIPLEEDNVHPVSGDVEISFGYLESGDENLGCKVKAQNPMVVVLVTCFKWADLGLGKVVVPCDCVVQRSALLPPPPRVVSGGDSDAVRSSADILKAIIRLLYVITEWKRVACASARWSAVKATDMDYFVFRVLQNPNFDDVPDFTALSGFDRCELVKIDNREFAATLSSWPIVLGPYH